MREPDNGRSPPWFARAFGELYPVLYRHRDDGAARREAAFAARVCGLDSTTPVLDLGCGGGRHLVALEDLGVAGIGLDLSWPLIAECRRRGLAALVRGDMRRLPFAAGSFAGVLSFFTSFGYFETDGEDRAVVSDVFRVLRAGGRYFLDYLDAEGVRRDLVPRSERVVSGHVILEERRIENGRVKKRVTVRRDDLEHDPCPVVFEESVRLYTREDLRALLEGAGLRVLETFGALDGRPAGRGDRCVLLAERP